MRSSVHLLMGGVAIAFGLSVAHPLVSRAAAQGTTALAGRVASAEEGAMEGVVVSAKRQGSTITISVVTDKDGHYAFPGDRLEPGHYVLKARATGYDLDGASAVDIAATQGATADLKLKKTRNLSAQLNNAEWLLSMPGTDEQKRFLLNCNSCHTYERIVKSTHDADEFLQVFARMAGYYPGSTPMKPQRLVGDARRELGAGDGARKTAEWLSTVNLSQQETWSYPLKTLPRLTGKSTRVIYTEYDLPNPLIEPHDVVLDREGMVWYSDFGQMFLGKMDPATGKVTQYPIPETKADFPRGTLDLERDANDDFWIGVMYQGSIAKFDRKTSSFQSWSIPAKLDSDAGQLGHLAVDGTAVDGKVWIKNSDGNNIYRLDLKTNQIENLGSFKDPATGKRIGSYGIHSDALNNLYLLDFAAGNIGRIDAKTEKFSVYATPTRMSRPRRGRVDDEGRLWFAEYEGDAIGMFDPKTEKFQEWKVPTPWSAPYDTMASKDGSAWTGSMMTDRVSRLDIKSGEYVEYPLPRPTNIRRVYVDDTKNPGVLWIGSNHGASIVKVEPLD